MVIIINLYAHCIHTGVLICMYYYSILDNKDNSNAITSFSQNAKKKQPTYHRVFCQTISSAQSGASIVMNSMTKLQTFSRYSQTESSLIYSLAFCL